MSKTNNSRAVQSGECNVVTMLDGRTWEVYSHVRTALCSDGRTLPLDAAREEILRVGVKAAV